MRVAAETVVPAAFATKKQNILSALAIPDKDYTDLSPKGSVDKRIRELISVINRLDGAVTTSSCAGRISVFLEGTKSDEDKDVQEVSEVQSLQVVVPGGKGRGGRWLFVSHDPVNEDLGNKSMKELCGMSTQNNMLSVMDPSGTRFVRFQFEPMILHVMTASLQHAQPILSAAIHAGFRESGVQSLKNLDDVNAFPMVAIRSSGLAFGSLIGCVNQSDNGEIRSLVSEEYLKLLLSIANDRFDANTVRTNRLQANLLQTGHKQKTIWEDQEARRERMKTEGLERRAKLRAEAGDSVSSTRFGWNEEVLIEGLDLDP